MRSRLLRGGLWAFLARMMAIGLSLGINALIARMLSPRDLGAYFLAMSVLGFVVGLAQMGQPQVVVRLVAESMSGDMFGRAKQTVKRAKLLSLTGGVIVALGFYLGLGDLLARHVLHSDEISAVIGTASLAVVILSLQGVITETYRGFHDIRAASLLGNVLPPAVLAGFLVLLRVNHDHTSFQQLFVLTVASAGVVLTVSEALLAKRLNNLSGAGTVAYRELLSIGWPLCLIQIAIFTSTQADIWIVGAFLSKEDVSIYGSMQKVSLFMTMTHSLVIAVVQSTVAELYAKGDMHKLQRVIQAAAFGACVPAALLLGIFVWWGIDILQVIFGEYYRQGYLPLLVLSIGQFIGMLLGPAGMVLIMTGHQKYLMLVIIATSLASVLMAAVFAIRFGVVGVATAWGAGAIVYGIWTWWLAFKLLNVKTHARISPDIIVWRNQ